MSLYLCRRSTIVINRIIALFHFIVWKVFYDQQKQALFSHEQVNEKGGKEARSSGCNTGKVATNRGLDGWDEVLLASDTEGNPYEKGERADLNTGLYCETVMNQCDPLLVPDALEDPEWNHNPGIELGMTFYFGFPLQWPDNEVFGTICVLDRENNPAPKNYRELISEFQQVIETDLYLIVEAAKRKKVEAQLGEKESLLRQMGDNLPNGMIYRLVHDSKGGRSFVYASKGCERLFQVTPESIKKDAGLLYNMISPEERQRVAVLEKQSIETLSPFNYEVPVVIPNGEVRWCKWHSKPGRLADGSLIWDGVCLDITELKLAEEALKKTHDKLERRVEEKTAELSAAVDKLQEAELRYRTVADFTYDWEYWANLDGTLQYVSPSCERISGYTPQQFMDNPSLYREIIIPEDQDVWEKHYHDSRKEPKAREIQFRIRRRDGSIRWIEHACQPVIGNQGASSGFRASNRDITERKRSEVALQKSEKNLAKAQRLAKLGNWQWDILTNKLEWSDEVFRIFGFTPQQFGATYDAFLEQVHPDDRNTVKAAVNQALEEPSAGYGIQHRIVKPDGSLGFVHEHGEVTFDESGKPVRMIGTVQDISELKALEAESQQLRAELTHLDRVTTMGAMTAAIAHEINQPLTAILSNAQAALRILRHDQPDLDEVEAALYDITADDKRAAEVIRRLRKILKGEEPLFEAYDFNAAFEEVIKLVHSEIVIQNVSVTKDLKSGLPTLYGDDIQMQQVILNLLINALDALKEQPEDARSISLSTQAEGNDGVTVTITDSGPGIDPDRIETIFNPFYTMKPQGMGLGLSISRSIIEAHGGHLRAENHPNGGATFT
ncbi:MAG: PAS domain-containing protein, partial [Deltaproteobacteria bacterium]|nr:PAS domain-containing protein [Deltaproteobacteria bacterium]